MDWREKSIQKCIFSLGVIASIFLHRGTASLFCYMQLRAPSFRNHQISICRLFCVRRMVKNECGNLCVSCKFSWVEMKVRTDEWERPSLSWGENSSFIPKCILLLCVIASIFLDGGIALCFACKRQTIAIASSVI